MNKIQEALEIANTYRTEHQGEIPVLVVAHTNSDTFILEGKFRSDVRGHGRKTQADQQQFVSVLRLVFASRDVKSYEVITKPEINNAALQLTQNLLAIFHVNAESTYGEFFEIEEDKLIPCYENLTVESWFAQLLPTTETPKITNLKTLKQLNQYIENCTYKMPTKEADTTPLDFMDFI